MKEVVFDSQVPWCRVAISKMKYTRNKSTVVGRSIESMIVFLPEDMNKAIAEPSIEVMPKAGECLVGELFFMQGRTKILLKDVKLKLCTLSYACPSLENGKVSVEVLGRIENEYERDYYVCLHAIAYDSRNIVGRSVDHQPICGSVVLHLKSGEEKEFKLYLELKENINKIRITTGYLSENSLP